MKIDNRDVFEQIGNAFYAIAVDQHVMPLEVAELKLLISDDWLPRNSANGQQPVSDEAHCILMTIDSLQGQLASANDAFKDFETFYRTYPEIFTSDLKQRIVKTAGDIVKLFPEDNKTPNRHFDQVKRLFESREQVASR